MPEIGNLEDRILHEIQSMRQDFQRVLETIAALSEKVQHISDGQIDTKGHGERLKALETEVSNIKGDIQSAATERRWMIGTIVTVAFGLVAAAVGIISLFMKH